MAGTAGGGTFVSNGGSLLLDTVLNSGAPSQSDVLVVDGVNVGAGGPIRTSVNNVGGAGDLTVGDGILVVEGLDNVPTSAVPRAFRLGAPAVAGPYEYLLFRGGAGAGAGDDWFLRDTIQPVQPEDGDPSTPPDPSAPPGTPRLRREVSLYAAAPAAAMLYGLNSIETLHERMGGDAQRLGSGSNGTYDGTPDGAWARAFGHWGHRDGPGIYIAGPSFDYGLGGVQMGFDLYRNEDQYGGRNNAGLYAGYGHTDVDVEHNLLGLTLKGGTDKLDAFSVGGYWTHFGPSDWYVDGVLQGTWYDIDMNSRRGLRDGETDGWGWAGGPSISDQFIAQRGLGHRFAEHARHDRRQGRDVVVEPAVRRGRCRRARGVVDGELTRLPEPRRENLHARNRRTGVLLVGARNQIEERPAIGGKSGDPDRVLQLQRTLML